jgi:hypothetical protein
MARPYPNGQAELRAISIAESKVGSR